jgi:hypothetical protein
MAQARIDKKPKTTDARQWILLAVAVAFFLVGAVFKFFPVADDTARVWSFNILTKVGFVMLTIALAWSQLKFLSGSSYGRILVVGLAAVALFFLIRPKSVTAVFPIILACVAIMTTVTFLRNVFLSPRK